MDFYNSWIEELIYDDEHASLELEIDLCNWKQIGSKDSTHEVATGLLMFSGVSAVVFDPEPFEIHRAINVSAEIIAIDVLSGKDGTEMVKLVLQLGKALLTESSTRILYFSATGASWHFV